MRMDGFTCGEAHEVRAGPDPAGVERHAAQRSHLRLEQASLHRGQNRAVQDGTGLGITPGEKNGRPERRIPGRPFNFDIYLFYRRMCGERFLHDQIQWSLSIAVLLKAMIPAAIYGVK